MLKTWSLQGFKSIAQPVELGLLPLTVLTGANSSGKSSLIQSILLVTQSLSSRFTERTVLLNGPLARLGNFSDVVSYGKVPKMRIAWTMTPPETGQVQFPSRTQIVEIGCEVALEENRSSESPELASLNPSLAECAITVTDAANNKVKVTATRKRESGVDADALLEELQRSNAPSYFQSRQAGLLYDLKIEGDLQAGLMIDADCMTVMGVWLLHFVPAAALLRVDGSKAMAKALTDFSPESISHIDLNPAYRDIMQSTAPEHALTFIVNELAGQDADLRSRLTTMAQMQPMTLQLWRQRARAAFASTSKDDRLYALATKRAEVADLLGSASIPLYLFAPYGQPLDTAVSMLANGLPPTVGYVGPLRDEPRPLQPLGIYAETNFVGYRGEQTAAVYERFKNEIITYVSPDSIENAEVIPETATLERALLKWLNYMGLAEAVTSRDLGKLGHELRVRTRPDGEAQDLTHVGVGVSQLLPVLLSCLIANTGSTMIFEQPEIHLHPRVQAQLGDFFLAVAMTGVQCIVETHSEHLINRLRYRTAMFPGSMIPSMTRIYFVENPRGQSEFRSIALNDFGAISDWPKGFFDQSQLEAGNIIRSAFSKRSGGKD